MARITVDQKPSLSHAKEKEKRNQNKTRRKKEKNSLAQSPKIRIIYNFMKSMLFMYESKKQK